MSNTEALRAAAQQALDAMNYSGMDVGKFNRINGACRALREALTASTHPADVSKSGAQIDIAAASGEPVAWFCEWFNADGSPEWDQYHDRTDPMPSDDEWEDRPPDRVTPLYAAPQPAPARVPLTNGDLLALWGSRSDGPDSREIVSYARAVLAAAPGAPDAQPTRAEGE